MKSTDPGFVEQIMDDIIQQAELLASYASPPFRLFLPPEIPPEIVEKIRVHPRLPSTVLITNPQSAG